MESILGLFKMLYAIYCFIKEIYLWYCHDSPEMGIVVKRKIVFASFVTLITISIAVDVYLVRALVKIAPYVNAYKVTAYQAIELNKRPIECNSDIIKPPELQNKHFKKIKHR